MRVWLAESQKRASAVCVTDSVVDVKAEGIFYSANNHLIFGSGVSGAILSLAGSELQKETSKLIKKQGPIPVGDCVVTDAYGRLTRRGFKKIFHLATLHYNPAKRVYEARPLDYLGDISRAVKSACQVATELNVRSVVIPLIGTRVGNITSKQSAAAIVRGVQAHVIEDGDQLTSIRTFYFSAFRSKQALEAFNDQISLVSLTTGDIIRAPCECIVISANNWLAAGSGTARAAIEQGGRQVEQGVEKIRQTSCPLQIGTAVICPSGKIADQARGQRRFLIQAVGLGYKQWDGRKAYGRILATPETVYQATVASLRLASSENVQSIALPLMCARAGYSTVPPDQAKRVMLTQMLTAINDTRPELSMKTILIYCDQEAKKYGLKLLLRSNGYARFVGS